MKTGIPEKATAAIKVRGAKAGDAATIARFDVALAIESEKKHLDERIVLKGVRKLIKSPSCGFYVVAEYNSEIAGCLMITFEWSDWRNAFFWWVQSVYVTPQFRRRNVFSALFEYTKNLAQKKNVCGLRLYVEKGNCKAQRAYLSMQMTASDYLMFESNFEDLFGK